jgi:hypothetical protein
MDISFFPQVLLVERIYLFVYFLPVIILNHLFPTNLLGRRAASTMPVLTHNEPLLMA